MLNSHLLLPEEQARFVAFNQRNNGAHVDLTYLKRAKTRVFYRPDAPDRWVSAYVVNTEAPFRCLSVLDSEHKTLLLRQHGLRESQIVEITLLCRDKSIGWLPGERAQYYATSIRDALKTRKRHLIGGTTDAQKLKTQMIILDSILYEGNMNLFGTPKHGWLLYTSLAGALKNVVWHLLTQFGRTLFPKRSRGRVASLPNS